MTDNPARSGGPRDARGSFVARAAGALLVVIALLYGALASRYVVTFVADPLGPRAAPFLLAALLALLGAWLVFGPSPAGDAVAHPPARRAAFAAAAFVAYALLLPWLGFVLATALLAGALAKLADGPVLRACVLGTLFAGALHYVFVFALDVPLPVGRLFPFLGG